MRYTELEGIGLTKSEIAVYVSLLKLGQSPRGKIIDEAGISSGKIYEILDKLIKKGLVGYVLKNNVKNFSAASPDKLEEYLSKRRREIEQKEIAVRGLIPDLKRIGGKKEEYSTEIFMGLKGIRSVVFDMANSATRDAEHLHMGVSGDRSEAVSLIWEQFSLIVTKKKSKARILIADSSEESIKRMNKLKKKFLKNYKFRFLDGFSLAPIMVLKNKTYIINWENPSIIVITSSVIAKQFRSFFESLWAIAKKS